MTRIGASLSGVDLTAQNLLARAVEQVNRSSVQLSTLKRINRASDDPAGLIALEQLRSELVSLERASSNADQTAAGSGTARGAPPLTVGRRRPRCGGRHRLYERSDADALSLVQAE